MFSPVRVAVTAVVTTKAVPVVVPAAVAEKRLIFLSPRAPISSDVLYESQNAAEKGTKLIFGLGRVFSPLIRP